MKSILKIVGGVIVAIALFVAWLTLNDGDTYENAQRDQASRGMQQIGQKLDLFLRHNGGYPYTEEGLEILVVKPAGDDNWAGPYIEANMFADPWKTTFFYASNGITYRLTSAGPDRMADTADDIIFPAK